MCLNKCTVLFVHFSATVLEIVIIKNFPQNIISKYLICIFVYVFWPELVQDSDAKLYYLPETLEFLSGKLPYKDFGSSYSPLFHLLLSIPLLLWKSLGSIVLTMITFETGMSYLYLRYCRNRRLSCGWRTSFLYAYSPFSYYWVTLVGYNGAIISFFVMLSLILADREKHTLSGLACTFSLLFSKLLAVLSWPGIIFFERRRWGIRALPMILIITILLCFAVFGVDILLPIKREFGRHTAGNIWFLMSTFIPGFNKSLVGNILPALLFVIIFAVFFRKFIKAQVAVNINSFNMAVAFIAATNLLFMILSKKTFTTYTLMMLIFILHTILESDKNILRYLIPMAFLGSLTTFEPYLQIITDVQYRPYFITEPLIFGLFILDLAFVGCYIYLMIFCFKASINATKSLDPKGQSI